MIFIDSGAWLARYLSRDQYHRKATQAWRRLESAGESCVTSNLVLNETFTLLGRRAGYPFAVERARSIYESTRLSILRPVLEDEIEALGLFEKFADQQVGFTDALTFALMRKNKLKRVFTFDSHFARAGFTLVP